MCLAIPGKVLSIEEQAENVFQIGKVSFGGITRKVNLGLVPEVKVGDYVLVHVGVALNVIDEAEAKKTLQFLQNLGELDDL